ncbi:TPA: hypothetical protein DEG21_00475 [Patescibacteria group bacterium]|nr:hypothetical protein [Candidatus Gracilibacteria bacterium]
MVKISISTPKHFYFDYFFQLHFMQFLIFHSLSDLLQLYLSTPFMAIYTSQKLFIKKKFKIKVIFFAKIEKI